MDTQAFQSRVQSRLGEFPTDQQCAAAFATLIREASATRTLVNLDGDMVSDEALVGHFGSLVLALTEAACVLGVDLEQAMAWGERAGEARAVSLLTEADSLVVAREGC